MAKKRRLGKKGNLEQFQGIVIALMVLGILVGASLLALVSFKDSVGTDACSTNAVRTQYSNGYCVQPGNVTNSAVLSSSSAFNGTSSWIDASTNLSSKAPTAGTLFGIGLIIFAVFGGIFYFMQGRKGSI